MVSEPARLTIDRTRARLDASAELGRRSLMQFVRRTHLHRPYGDGAMHHRICAALERFSRRVEAGESPRLIITTPPRHGKTAIVSQRWPVWHLGRNPEHEVVCCSYGQDLADDSSRAAREIAQGAFARRCWPGLAPHEQADKIDRASNWRTGRSGGYKAVGIGGPLTGRGAHVLVVDDYLKDRQEADSETRRNQVWNWYISVAYTRLAPGGGVLVMATRWHEDDLIGRLLAAQEQGGDQWEVIHLPAVAEEDEPLDPADLTVATEAVRRGVVLPLDDDGRSCWRLAGEALDPARYPVERLEQIRSVITQHVGLREWSALYQGRPAPRGGGILRRDWFRARYTCPPEDLAAQADEVWISVDAAKKGSSTSDLHALHVWARSGSKRQLLDRVAGRMGYPEFESALDGLIGKWARYMLRGGGVLIEDTANGTTYLQVRGASYLGVPLIGFSPTRDTPGSDKSKGARAVYLERSAESGAIELPESGEHPWVEDVITWWCAFPVGAHDDDVDAASQILMRWTLADSTEDDSGWWDIFAPVAH